LRNKSSIILIIAIFSASLLSGCSSPSYEIVEPGNQESFSDSDYSADDIMFAQMMIPHHEQAVDMSLLAELAASDELIKQLAREIADEQGPEIEQMKNWIGDSKASDHMGHSMPMNGMVSEEQMSALLDASGPVFDKLFLELMIQHHKGAIEMAQMIVNSKNSEARTLGQEIIRSQSEQIAYMESLLSK